MSGYVARMIIMCRIFDRVKFSYPCIFAIVAHVSQINRLRIPYYLTGRYKPQDVDSGTWKTVDTLSPVIYYSFQKHF